VQFQNRYTDDLIEVSSDVLIAYYQGQTEWVQVSTAVTPGISPYQRIGTTLQLKGATAATWAASSYIPAVREPVVAYDTGDVRIGDGINLWPSLPSTVGGGSGGAALTSWVTQVVPLADFPAVIASGATQAAARTAIGAGTSSLVLGSSSSQAKAGDYHEAWSTLTGKPVVIASGADAVAARSSIGFDAAVDARLLPYDSVSWDNVAGAWSGPGNARPVLPAWVPAKYYSRLYVSATLPSGAYAFQTGDMIWLHPSSSLWP
jgi:hypothetical protein